MLNPIEKGLILKIIHIKKQKNGINDINNTKLLDLINTLTPACTTGGTK